MKKIILAVLVVVSAQTLTLAQNISVAKEKFIYNVRAEYFDKSKSSVFKFWGSTEKCTGVMAINNILIMPYECFGGVGSDYILDVLTLSQENCGKEQSFKYEKREGHKTEILDNRLSALKLEGAKLDGAYIMTFYDDAVRTRTFEGRIPEKNKKNPAAIFLTSPKGTPVIIAVRNTTDGGYTHISKEAAATLQKMGAKIVNERFEEVTIVQPELGKSYRKKIGDIVENLENNNQEIIENIQKQIGAVPFPVI